jgi:hypothetical protein
MNSSPYSVALLNDLHHYFPDLLYRSERFQTVHDVLQYVISVAQESPYERERQRYRRAMPSLEPESEREREWESEREREREREGKDPEESEDHRNPNELDEKEYSFTVSRSAYTMPSSSTHPPSTPPSSSIGSSSSSTMDPDSIFRALLEPRPLARPTSRFRLSVPLDLSSFLSPSYLAPAPSSLHSLSQLSDLLRPVVIRPTEQHLAENTYVYRSEVAHQENCAICQDPMEAGQETRTILACSHCFHRECIDRWFQEHVRCPTCRRDVREAC